jgi:hypothetical protein
MTIQIPLTQGKTVTVDQSDADRADVKWHAIKDKNTFYAVRNVARPGGGWTSERLHRVIMARMLGRPLERREHVDHINRDGLDNRRENLRLASNRENHCNRRNQGASEHPGVSWHKATRKWRAQIRINGRQRHLGSFTCELDAAEAYRRAGLVRRPFLKETTCQIY